MQTIRYLHSLVIPKTTFTSFDYRRNVCLSKKMQENATASKASNLHEALTPISWLAGCWTTTEGRGKYPNIPEFKYHEELEFTCVGQPMYNFMSTSHHPQKQTPMHLERGFLRIKPGTNELGFAVSHNFGLTSLEEGTYDPETKTITFETVNISRMSFAKQPHVTKFKREFKLLDDGNLEMVMFMETERTPLTEHLRTIYQKV